MVRARMAGLLLALVPLSAAAAGPVDGDGVALEDPDALDDPDPLDDPDAFDPPAARSGGGGAAPTELGRRDLLQLSVGPVFRTDRGRPAAMKGGVAIAAEVPVVWRFNLRADFASPFDAQGALRVRGWLGSLMAVYHQPIDMYAIDLGVGPSLWLGPSAWWEGAEGGPWPGMRAALGGSIRPHPWVGGRLELGTDHAWAGREWVTGSSHGFDVRLMVTGFLP